jgi:hypothetical protein
MRHYRVCCMQTLHRNTPPAAPLTSCDLGLCLSLSLCHALPTVLRVRQGHRRRVILFSLLFSVAFFMYAKAQELNPIFPIAWLPTPTFKSNAASERFYGITCSSIPLGVSFLYPLISDCMLDFVCEHVQYTSCFCAHNLKQNSVLPRIRMKRRVYQADQKSFYLEVSFCRHFVILLAYCDRSLVHFASS